MMIDVLYEIADLSDNSGKFYQLKPKPIGFPDNWSFEWRGLDKRFESTDPARLNVEVVKFSDQKPDELYIISLQSN